MALVAYLRDVEKEQMPRGNRLHPRHRPGIDEIGVDHAQAGDAAQKNVAAEYPRRADGNQYRQISKRRGGYQVQKAIPIRGRKAGNGVAQRLYQTHHQSRGHNGREDGDKYVPQCLHHPLGQRLVFRGGGLDLVLGGGCHARYSQKFVVHLVDHAGAEYQL